MYFCNIQSSPKKVRTDQADAGIDGISDALKAFTSNQLITVIKKLLTKRPELEKVSKLFFNDLSIIIFCKFSIYII